MREGERTGPARSSATKPPCASNADADTHYNLALALKYAGQARGRGGRVQEALGLQPGWAEAEYGLGASLYDLQPDAGRRSSTCGPR